MIDEEPLAVDWSSSRVHKDSALQRVSQRSTSGQRTESQTHLISELLSSSRLGDSGARIKVRMQTLISRFHYFLSIIFLYSMSCVAS